MEEIAKAKDLDTLTTSSKWMALYMNLMLNHKGLQIVLRGFREIVAKNSDGIKLYFSLIPAVAPFDCIGVAATATYVFEDESDFGVKNEIV